MVWKKAVQPFETSRTPKEEEQSVNSIHCSIQKGKAGEHNVTEVQRGGGSVSKEQKIDIE